MAKKRTPKSRLDVPTVVLDAIQQLEEDYDATPAGEDTSSEFEPFVFIRSWEFENLPRNIEEEIVPLLAKKGATTLCSVTTEGAGTDGGPYSGTVLMRDDKAYALYRLDWRCPEYCDDESDATGTLTVHWTVQQDFYEGHLITYSPKVYQAILNELLWPISQVERYRSSDPALSGALIGQALRARLSQYIQERGDLDAYLQDIAKGLLTPPAS